MGSSAASWSVALIAAVFACRARGQDPAPAAGVDLSIRVPFDEPSALTIHRSMTWGFTGASAALREQKNDVEDIVIVDTKLAAQGTDAQRCMRTFVKWHATADGAVRDPPWNGVTAEYLEDANGASIKLQDDYLLPQAQLNELIRFGAKQALGTLEFASAAQVGEAVTADLAGLALLALCRADRVNVTESSLKFASVDATTQHAVVSGSVRGKATRERRTGRVEAAFDLAVTIEIDTAAHALVRATFAGPLVLSGYVGKIQIEGSGTASARIDAARGNAARAASKSVPKPRVVHHEFEQLDLSMDLPSSWAIREWKGDRCFFVATRKSGNDEALISLTPMEEKTDDLDVLGRWILDEQRKRDRGVSLKNTSTPLGKALEYDGIEDDGKRSKNLRIQIEGKKYLLISLLGTADGIKALAADFQKAKASMKRLEPR